MANLSPKISVIVPVYNVEQYLPRCIDSILSQTFTDFELLLIDDGSKDASGRICDEYVKQDCRIRVFHKENGGVSSAINLGIEESQGEYIIFVDSDDWLEPSCYSSLMMDNNISDLTFFGCNCWFNDGGKTSYAPHSCLSLNKKDIEECLAYLKGNCQRFEYLGYTWNKLFKKNIIDDYHILFEKGLSFREDELFTLSYARYVASLRIKSDILYNYRVGNTTGLTYASKSLYDYTTLSKQLDMILPFYNNVKLLSLEYKSLLSYLFQIITFKKFLSKSWIKSVNKYIKIERLLRTKFYMASSRMSIKYRCVLYQYFICIIRYFLYIQKWKLHRN